MFWLTNSGKEAGGWSIQATHPNTSEPRVQEGLGHYLEWPSTIWAFRCRRRCSGSGMRTCSAVNCMRQGWCQFTALFPGLGGTAKVLSKCLITDSGLAILLFAGRSGAVLIMEHDDFLRASMKFALWIFPCWVSPKHKSGAFHQLTYWNFLMTGTMVHYPPSLNL